MRDFTDFFELSYDKVLAAMTLAIGSEVRAEEVTQDAFARALHAWPRVSAMDNAVGWIYRVALNRHRRDVWRADRLRSLIPMTPRSLDPTEGTEAKVMVRTLLAGLTQRQRVAVVLRYFSDLPIHDIAAVMGCAPGTVKATLNAALTTMRVETEP